MSLIEINDSVAESADKNLTARYVQADPALHSPEKKCKDANGILRVSCVFIHESVITKNSFFCEPYQRQMYERHKGLIGHEQIATDAQQSPSIEPCSIAFLQ